MTKFQFLRRVAALVLVAASFVVSAPATAQTASLGGSANVRAGNGFGCGAGMTYQMVNGVARCQQPSPTQAAAASCAATTMTAGACSYSFPATTSGSTPLVSNSVAGYAGTASATCSAGSWSGVSGVTCSANPCSSATHSNGSCAFTAPALSSGTSTTVSNSTSGYTGSSTATCTAGTLSWSGDSCAVVMQPCGAATGSWGSGCSGTVSAAGNGVSVTATNSVQYYSSRRSRLSALGARYRFGRDATGRLRHTPKCAGIAQW